MDSLTQLVLGAGVGEATLGKKVGNRTVLWGAIIATVPDLDVIPAIWMDTVDRLSFHRGFSHSLLFFILASPVFGWLLQKLYAKFQTTWREWTLFSFLVLFTHALLDCFTSWGTQLFWPHPYRVAWNTIFVVDPLYTVPFMIAIIWMMFYKRSSKTRQRINYAGLTISSAYLLLTVVNKQIVDHTFESALSKQGIQYQRYSTKPMPLNNILWFGLVESDDGYYLGYYSFLDSNKNIDFSYVAKNHELLEPFVPNDELSTLMFISMGYYTVEEDSTGILFHDLRFGQSINPPTGKREYIFTFLINKDNPGKEVDITRKERSFKDVSGEMFALLWRRILGDKNIRM